MTEATGNRPQPPHARLWAAVRPVLARAYHAAQRFQERWLHASRRRQATALVGDSAGWERALVLCHGNVCRSPYAALYLARLVEARGVRLMVTQGGFIGPGRRSPVTARACARAAGVELRRHRSRLFTTEDLTGRTLVVVMEQRQARRVAREHGVPPHRILVLGDLDPESIEARDIPDPWRHGPEVFEAVYRRIARCTEILATSLRPPPSAESVGPIPRAGAAPHPGSGHPLAPGHKPEEVRPHHA